MDSSNGPGGRSHRNAIARGFASHTGWVMRAALFLFRQARGASSSCILYRQARGASSSKFDRGSQLPGTSPKWAPAGRLHRFPSLALRLPLPRHRRS